MGNRFETPNLPLEHANSHQREQLERDIAGRKQYIQTLEAAQYDLIQTRKFANWRNQCLRQIAAVSLEIQTLRSKHINLEREHQAMTVENRHLTLLKEKTDEEWRGRRLRRTNVSSTAQLTSMLRDLDVKLDGLWQSKIELEREVQTIYPGRPKYFSDLERETRSLSARLKELEAERENLKQQNGFIENSIKKLSVDNRTLQSHINVVGGDLRQSTQAQRTETRTSQNTQGPDYQVNENNEKANDPALECAICLLSLKDGRPVSVTPCRHRFHTACIEDYIKIRNGTAPCPHCRGNIPGVSSLTPQAQWIQKNPYMTMFSQFAVYIDK
jgi:chromosome segregation ATPase